MVTSEGKLRELHLELRQAVGRGGFAQAEALLAALSHAVEEHLRRMGPGSKEAETLLKEYLQILAWARRTALAARAHDAARLARLRSAASAYRAPRPPSPSICLRA